MVRSTRHRRPAVFFKKNKASFLVVLFLSFSLPLFVFFFCTSASCRTALAVTARKSALPRVHAHTSSSIPHLPYPLHGSVVHLLTFCEKKKKRTDRSTHTHTHYIHTEKFTLAYHDHAKPWCGRLCAELHAKKDGAITVLHNGTAAGSANTAAGPARRRLPAAPCGTASCEVEDQCHTHRCQHNESDAALAHGADPPTGPWWRLQGDGRPAVLPAALPGLPVE